MCGRRRGAAAIRLVRHRDEAARAPEGGELGQSRREPFGAHRDDRGVVGRRRVPGRGQANRRRVLPARRRVDDPEAARIDLVQAARPRDELHLMARQGEARRVEAADRPGADDEKLHDFRMIAGVGAVNTPPRICPAESRAEFR